jgi:hypothetical protein
MDHSTGAPVTAAVAMKQVEHALAVLVGSTGGGAVRDLTHEELTGLVGAGRRAQAQIEAAVLAAVGEVDARGSHVHEGALTVGAWLRAHTRVTPAEAAATARTARALHAGLLPATTAALGAGEISARHAQVIADGIHTTTSGGHRGPAPAEAVALIEPEVLDVARHADTRAAAAVMAAFQHALDPEAADAAALRRWERRGLTIAPTVESTSVINGLADETSAAVIVAAIDAAAPLVTGDTRTPAQIRLDALVGICRQWLENPDAPTRGGGGHPHVIVTTDDASLFPDDHTLFPRRPGRGRQRPRRRPRPRDRDRRVDDDRVARRDPVGHRPHPGLHRAAAGLRRRADHRAARPRRRGHRDPHRPPILHLLATPGDDRPRRRPLPLAVVRPTGQLVRRAPPHLVHPRRPDHRRQRSPPVSRAPHRLPRRRLDPAPPPRRPLPRNPPRRPQHRSRTPPTRPQPATSQPTTPATRMTGHHLAASPPRGRPSPPDCEPQPCRVVVCIPGVAGLTVG